MPPSETTATKFSIDITVFNDKDNSLDTWDVSTPKNRGDEVQVENDILAENARGNRIYDMGSPEDVTSENMWERTEVLAGKDRCLTFTASLLFPHVWFLMRRLFFFSPVKCV